MTIWKYTLEVTDTQNIPMPKGSKILSVQAQENRPCIWALVNPNKELEPRRFEMYSTGHPLTFDSRDYLGTFQLDQEALVFHLFEYLNQ